MLKALKQKLAESTDPTLDAFLENFSLEMTCRSNEEKYIFDILTKRQSLLLHGQWGVGKSFVAQRVTNLLQKAGHKAHYFRWSTPAGDFVKEICKALDLKTQNVDEETEKATRIPQAQLLNDIGAEIRGGQHIIILDQAHSIPVAIRNHIGVWLESGAVLLLVATLPKRSEIYLKFPRYELPPLDYQRSVKLVLAAVRHYDIKLTSNQVRELATHGNGNPQFLIRAVKEQNIGILADPDQNEWIDGTPIVLGLLALLMVLRVVGMGLSDRNLIVMGGLGTAAMRLTQITVVRMSSKRGRIE